MNALNTAEDDEQRLSSPMARPWLDSPYYFTLDRGWALPGGGPGYDMIADDQPGMPGPSTLASSSTLESSSGPVASGSRDRKRKRSINVVSGLRSPKRVATERKSDNEEVHRSNDGRNNSHTDMDSETEPDTDDEIVHAPASTTASISASASASTLAPPSPSPTPTLSSKPQPRRQEKYRSPTPALHTPDALSEYTCPICFCPPTSATITPCGHICCGSCLFTAVKTTLHRGAMSYTREPNVAKCPVCRAPIPGWDGRGGGVFGLKPKVVISL